MYAQAYTLKYKMIPKATDILHQLQCTVALSLD